MIQRIAIELPNRLFRALLIAEVRQRVATRLVRVVILRNVHATQTVVPIQHGRQSLLVHVVRKVVDAYNELVVFFLPYSSENTTLPFMMPT